MLPVVYGTGGPPSSRRRRRATIFLGAVSAALGDTNRNAASSSSIIRPTSTATVMTTAFGLLMILLPAAYPDKISIGECYLVQCPPIVVIGHGQHISVNMMKQARTSRCTRQTTKTRCATVPTVMEGCCTRLAVVGVYSTLDESKYSPVLDVQLLRSA